MMRLIQNLKKLALQLSDKKDNEQNCKNNLILFQLPKSSKSDPDDQLKDDFAAVKEVLENKISLSSDAIINMVPSKKKH